MGSQKALAALITSAVAFVFIHFGVNDAEGELQGAVVTVLTTLAVYLTPNRA
jgi:hypothetical protein